MRYGFDDWDLLILNNPILGDTRLFAMRDEMRRIESGSYKNSIQNHNDSVYHIRRIFADYLDTITSTQWENYETLLDIHKDSYRISNMYYLSTQPDASTSSQQWENKTYEVLKTYEEILDEFIVRFRSSVDTSSNINKDDVSGNESTSTIRSKTRKPPERFIHWQILLKLINVSFDVPSLQMSYFYWDIIHIISTMTSYKQTEHMKRWMEDDEYLDKIESMMRTLYNIVTLKLNVYSSFQREKMESVMSDIYLHSEIRKNRTTKPLPEKQKRALEECMENDPFYKKYPIFAQHKVTRTVNGKSLV